MIPPQKTHYGYSLRGWNDAGGASTWAIRSLIEKTIATEILTFDSEDFMTFLESDPPFT